ncbi:hypothetical protein FRC05_002930 [Tulasnella sp. 425]|nr:hypothetical protein FRC05_002930 [Tulasnella sp. 425]
MRNLSLASTSLLRIEDLDEFETVVGATFDVDNDSVVTVSEIPSDAETSFQVWRMHTDSPPKLVAKTTCTTSGKSLPFPSAQLISATFLPEARTVCVVSAGGDIATGLIDDETTVCELEIVGSVESGIECAEWSPDHDVLALVAGDGNILLMTKDYEIIYEAPLRTTEKGEDQAVNVGWGSKETQFHGTAGKGAAAASAEQAATAARGGSSPDDDGRARVSWRGDGAFFVVSSLDPHAVPPQTIEPHTHVRRVLRVYDRSGRLQNTSEPVPGLEQGLAWKPSGSVIVSSQRFGFLGGGQGLPSRHDVVFFERNGLRHGEFGLREYWVPKPDTKRQWSYRVKEFAWNADSTILAAWIERDDGDAVQLWTTGNWHWYLKQEISAPSPEDGSTPRFTAVAWHPEQPLRIVMTSPAHVDDYCFMWDTCTSTRGPPKDTGTVAVVDGAALLMTPFRLQVRPPPESSYKIVRPPPRIDPPIHVSQAPNADALICLFPNARVELWWLQTAKHVPRTPQDPDVAEPSLIWKGEVPGDLVARQALLWNSDDASEEWFIALLGIPEGGRHDVVSVTTWRGGEINEDYEVTMPSIGHGRIFFLDGCKLAWEGIDGQVTRVDFENEVATPLVTLPEYCPRIQSVARSSDSWVICGLSETGKLHVVSTNGTNATLSTGCTSFAAGAGFLVFTTTSHTVTCIPLAELLGYLESVEETPTLPNWDARRTERGARLVTVVPSTMSVILQAPRGNLETVHPRPMVLSVVKDDIEEGDYRKALLDCRRHRIDLNILYDHEPRGFMSRLWSFVDQIEEVDYINLFLTDIGKSPRPAKLTAEICDAVRAELEKKDVEKYINSILTTHMVKTPPDIEAGLALLLRLRETNPNLVEEAVKYIIFLADPDTLFDVALGMYDFSLALLIAQHSPKKDPREYLPFLKQLKEAGEVSRDGYRRFKIDDHLKRYKKALQGLHDAGPKVFEEALTYTDKHRLHHEALEIWAGKAESVQAILNLYGEYLFERREFKQAALAFVRASKPQRAIIAYEKAYAWQELFALVVKEGRSFDELLQMGQRVGEDLASRKRYSEAGRVLLDYAKNVEEAITAFAQGGDFPEADRQCALNSRMDLVETILYPEALEVRYQIGEDATELKEQLERQVERLKELKVKKATDPDGFYNPDGERSANLQDVDVMTDAGSTVAGTIFTRYTAAPSSGTKKSKVSSKNSKKRARKTGRKGTVEEEEYILLSIGKMPGRLEAIQGKFIITSFAGNATLIASHQEEGKELQRNLKELESKLRSTIDEVWPDEDEEEAPVPPAASGTGSLPPRQALPRKPEMTTPGAAITEWEVKLL